MKIIKKVAAGFAILLLLLATTVVITGWHLSDKIPPELIHQFETLAYYEDGQFFNEERQAAFDFSWNSLYKSFSGPEQREPPSPLPVVKIEPGVFDTEPSSGLTVTWLGHSSAMVEMDGYRLMVDPEIR